MSKQYKSPPLIEAYCEIQFEGSKWDIIYPAEFYNAVKEDFPIKETIELQDFHVVINDDNVGVKPNAQFSKPILQCTNEKQNVIIQFTEKVLILRVVSPYMGWLSFKELILDIYDKCFNVIGDREIKRVNLVYKNTLKTGKSHSYENTKKYFNLYPNIPNNHDPNIGTAIQMLVELPSKDNRSVLVIQQSTLNPVNDIEAPIALNIKYICLFPESIQFESWLEDAHNSIQDTFESSITEFSKSKF